MIADAVFILLGYSHNVLWLCHLATFCIFNVDVIILTIMTEYKLI